MKLPLLKGKKTTHPQKPICPQCKRRKVFEPHSMAIFAGGSTYKEYKRGAPELEAFASLTWHGAHDTGVGDDRDLYTVTDLARDCEGGQFEIYFCSTSCLRVFFNSWVDALEAKVLKEKRRNAKTRAA